MQHLESGVVDKKQRIARLHQEHNNISIHTNIWYRSAYYKCKMKL